MFLENCIRESSHSVLDKDWFHISPSNSSSTCDGLQNLQSSQESSKLSGLNATSGTVRPDRAVSSFMKMRSVPLPPTNIDNLHLSQVFRTSSSSSQSQPTADFGHSDFGSDTERSLTSDFISQSEKDDSFADSRKPEGATFKVPYKNSKPVVKVVRQDTAPVASGREQDSSQRPTADRQTELQADNGNGLSDVATDDSQNAFQNSPTLPEVYSSTNFARTPRFQRKFGGVHATTATLSQQASIDISSSGCQSGHVGDTPLALSGNARLKHSDHGFCNRTAQLSLFFLFLLYWSGWVECP